MKFYSDKSKIYLSKISITINYKYKNKNLKNKNLKSSSSVFAPIEIASMCALDNQKLKIKTTKWEIERGGTHTQREEKHTQREREREREGER